MRDSQRPTATLSLQIWESAESGEVLRRVNGSLSDLPGRGDFLVVVSSPHPTGRRRYRPLRRPASLLVVVTLLACAGAATAGSASSQAPAFRDSIITSPRTVALQRAAAAWGGTYTTARGEQVRVLVSDSYPQDQTRPQYWADFLSSLLHGSELATLTLYVAPYTEVQRICGRGSLACYDSQRSTIYAPGEQVANDISAESIVAHEYGHHVAANRTNTPWSTLDYGTKRWASYENVCARTETGELHPGDEMEAYQLNPGEAFAETFRVLNERRLGIPESAWTIVDRRFYPDAEALARTEQDVTQPWQGTTAVTLRGRVAARAMGSLAVATPLDGRIAVTIRTSTTVRAQLLVGGRVVATRSGRSASFTATVCGTRSATVRVRAATKAATYTLLASRP